MILKVILLLTNIISVSSANWCSDSPMQMCSKYCGNQAVQVINVLIEKVIVVIIIVKVLIIKLLNVTDG